MPREVASAEPTAAVRQEPRPPAAPPACAAVRATPTPSVELPIAATPTSAGEGRRSQGPASDEKSSKKSKTAEPLDARETAAEGRVSVDAPY
jgi:hypothetical protein